MQDVHHFTATDEQLLESRVRISEGQLLHAMQHFGAKNPAVTPGQPLPAEVNDLAEVLATLWFGRRAEVVVSRSGRVAALVRDAGAIPAPSIAATKETL